MTQRSEFFKLSELRAKTDRQLLALLTKRLDTGLEFARLVAEPESLARRSTTEFHAGAEKAYVEVRTLLPWLKDVSKPERRRLESRLEQLGGILEDLSMAHGLRNY